MFVGGRSASCAASSRGRVGDPFRSRRPRQKCAQANHVVRRGGKGHDPIDEFATAVSQLPQPAHHFHPAKDLLDQLALLLTDGISRMTSGAAIDGRADRFLRHVRRDRERPYRGDEGRDIEILVAADGAPGWRTGFEQQVGRVAFGRARRRRHADVGHQPVAIVEQHMPGIRELRLATGAFPREHGIGIRRGLMRVVLSRFPMEIHRRIAGIVGRRLRPFALATKALETRPSLEQHAIDGEVFVREQTRGARLSQDRVKECAAPLLVASGNVVKGVPVRECAR